MFANTSTRKWIAALIITLVCSFLLRSRVTMGQESLRKVAAVQIAVDSDILTAFVDEPCRHFEAARDDFVLGENRQVAQHLRIASAFLRLESARARADGKLALEASVSELQRLADAMEHKQVQTVQVLQQAFARAHYALAGHHCINSAHRCCQPAALKDKHQMSQVGHDLNAAAIHLKHGEFWNGGELNGDALRALDTAQFSDEQLINFDEVPQSNVVGAIQSVRNRLENLTGRRITLAPPLTDDDTLGSSMFR